MALDAHDHAGRLHATAGTTSLQDHEDLPRLDRDGEDIFVSDDIDRLGLPWGARGELAAGAQAGRVRRRVVCPKIDAGK